jgi:GWxTD domain-containing protein
VDVPVVAGLLRPVILLPAGLLTGLPAAQLEYLLLHELAHIRRFDYAMNLVQTAVEGLLFYHPAVWWVSGVLREERENCCDDEVLASGADALAYAETLHALETARPRFALAANGGSLKARVSRILGNPGQPRRTVAPFLSTAMLALGVAAVLLTAQTKPDRWLDDEVRYIIQKQEREAYQALQTDEERLHFVEQFWLRRDPTPGTPRNEFKEEHYRRLNFADTRLGGRASDRGRIYILYGPPDEIDAHLSDPVPWVMWQYRMLEGIGANVKMEFRDEDHNGIFRMTRDPNPK